MMNMEKKEYIAPECEIIEMEGAVYMLDTSFDVGLGEDKEDENDSGSLGSNRHRGEWGNLWSNIK